MTDGAARLFDSSEGQDPVKAAVAVIQAAPFDPGDDMDPSGTPLYGAIRSLIATAARAGCNVESVLDYLRADLWGLIQPSETRWVEGE